MGFILYVRLKLLRREVVTCCAYRLQDPVVTRRDPGLERRTGGKSSPMALIAGITVAILVILVIIAVLVYRHRHSV